MVNGKWHDAPSPWASRALFPGLFAHARCVSLSFAFSLSVAFFVREGACGGTPWGESVPSTDASLLPTVPAAESANCLGAICDTLFPSNLINVKWQETD